MGSTMNEFPQPTNHPVMYGIAGGLNCLSTVAY
jgi:hypothetical protein